MVRFPSDNPVELHLQRYGLWITQEQAVKIRHLLREEIFLESRGVGDTEIMKLYCVQLFGLGDPDDLTLLWQAKNTSFDATCSIDFHLLSGSGRENILRFLERQTGQVAEEAKKAFQEMFIDGVVDGYSHEGWMQVYSEYYSVVEAGDSSPTS